MFNNFANYLLGMTGQQTIQHAPAEEVNVRLSTVLDDDWILVEHDSEGDTDMSSSLESITDTNALNCEPQYKSVALMTRSSSTSSLPCVNIEESWFLTPPPCFTSAGPVHMETSPLENLLIEHPSMSVYQHSSNQPAIAVAVTVTGVRSRHSSAPSGTSVTAAILQCGSPPMKSAVHRESESTVHQRPLHRHRTTDIRPRVLLVQQRHVDTLKQQERQCVNIKNAQKLQIHKACQSFKRGYFERNNKAREVNYRNHRQRRGEKSQGSGRSNANNNRKC